MHNVEDSLDTVQVGTAAFKLVGVLELKLLKTGSFSLRSQVFFTLDQNLGVMDPGVVEGGPRRGSVVLEHLKLVHNAEDCLDTFHVGSTFS